MIYLDNSATTAAFDEAVSASVLYMQQTFFNAASAYSAAIHVEKAIQCARARIARELRAQPSEVVFTSGGTESNNMAIGGVVKRMREKGRIITTVAEHPSVLEMFRALETSGHDVIYLGVDETGSVDLQALNRALSETTALVSIMHVNNETGAINDIDGAYDCIKRVTSAPLHVDGVQAFMKAPLSGKYDLYSISGHKFHGPKGVGALLIRGGTAVEKGQLGGGQEAGRRSGTHNTPGIMGMDAAVEKYTAGRTGFVEHMRQCKRLLANHLLEIADTVVNGPDPEQGAPHILNISFLGVRGEVLLRALDEREVYVSTGSACSARSAGVSRVLAAMGITGKRAEGALRLSVSPMNTLTQMDEAAQHIRECVAQLRRYQRR